MAGYEFDLTTAEHLIFDLIGVDLPKHDLSFASFDFAKETERVRRALERFFLLPETERARARSLVIGGLELACRSLPDVLAPTVYRRLVLHEWLAMVSLDQPDDRPPARGHVFHPAAVATTGWWFLTKRRDASGASAKQAIAGWLEREYAGLPFAAGLTSPDRWLRAVERAWILAALLHDFCYPYELLGKLGHRLVEGYGGFLADMRSSAGVTSDLVDLMRQGPEVLASGFAEDMVKGALGEPSASHSHAGLGAVYLLSLREHLADEVSKAAVSLAAEAVLLHHTAAPDKLARSPLGFLLAVSDCLQEWGRVIIKPLPPQKTRGNVTISSGMPCLAVRVEAGDVFRAPELDVVFALDMRRLRRYSAVFSWDRAKFLAGKTTEMPSVPAPDLWGLPRLKVLAAGA